MAEQEAGDAMRPSTSGADEPVRPAGALISLAQASEPGQQLYPANTRTSHHLCKQHAERQPGSLNNNLRLQAQQHLQKQAVVTAWEVIGKVDYEKLCKEFGCTPIPRSLIERIEKLTGVPPHPFLKRGVFYAHRDMEELLDLYEKGEKFYLYTGRGPSSEALHLGHLIPFMFTKWLQDAFKCPLVIQLTDDEKCLVKSLDVDEARRLAVENCKDIIACGFDVRRTFIFSDFEYVGGEFYRIVNKISGKVSVHKAKKTFGFTDDDNIGKVAFPAVQAAPSFSSVFPHMFGKDKRVGCLIPCAIDQDPYFRITRDVAPSLGFKKPALIESIFFPALQGDEGKMSASVTNSAIFVSDSAKQIKDKINKYAVSGGRQTEKEHRELGADLSIDVPYKWLEFFLDDQEEFERIGKEYAAGCMLTGEVKQVLISLLQKLVGRHQRARAMVSEEVVQAFMRPRKMTDLWG